MESLTGTHGLKLDTLEPASAAAEITSEASFARFYATVGWSDNPGRLDTRAAMETAAQVAAELRSRAPEGPRHNR